MKKFSWILVSTLAIAGILYSCGKSSNDGGTDNPPGGFDKTIMLAYYADSLIVPGYTALQQKVVAFQTAAEAFFNAPSSTTQDAARLAYKEMHLQYERVAVFQFGPAETELLDPFLNYSGGLDYNFNSAGELTGFSVDSVNIESYISSGNYTFTNLTRTSFYTQGFPAVNYLFFGPNAVMKFSTNTVARVKYARDVVTRIKVLADKVAGAWPAYRASFISNTKTNVGSPIGSLVNQFAYQMDLLKGPRIGWPFGKQSNGTVFASKCEAYYAGISTALAIENMTALKKTYMAAGSGKGISDYLVSLGKTTLNNDVLAQFDLVIGKLQLIPEPLSASLTAQPSLVENAYKEIQKLLTLLKTDVASATAVQISYMDNDGD